MIKITKIHDQLFKKLLETFFVEFIELFFPQVSQLIDKTCWRFNQQEILTDIKDMEEHKIDIIVETKLADEEGLILIHVESQAQRVLDYNRKMFKYFARLHEKYQQKILPIVIYSHDIKLEEPTDYRMTFSFLKVLEFNFFTVQLNKKPWREYINSSNPVAAALLGKMNYLRVSK